MVIYAIEYQDLLSMSSNLLRNIVGILFKTTNRKVSLYNDIYFCSAYNIYICISCHKLIHNEKDIVGMKKELKKKFLKEQEEKKLGQALLSPTSNVHVEMLMSHGSKTQCV